jgi:cell surface protein SprA
MTTSSFAPAFLPDTIAQEGTKQLSRRARIIMEQQAEQKANGEIDTTFNALAAIRALPRDSSARMEQFKAVRIDPLVVNPLRPKTDLLYLPDPLQIRYRDVLDSAQWIYHIRRSLGNWDTKIPIDLSFKEYAQMRLQRTIRSNWETLAQAYTLESEKQKGLGELFGKVTNIQIPVPKNPIFSIFGPNIINLHINGGVDVTAGFRNTKNDLIASDPLSQSRSEPEFKQDVQVTVAGEIGDKLKISADWDTKRTFEYENQLKVKYTGYEDDMIQSIEAGNVSLPLSSSFISSSQALFGIKAAFQFGPLRLTTIASQKKGEIKALSVSGGAQPTPFTIRATDYSKDHYFVDTSYIQEYPKVFLDIPADPDVNMQIRDIEVWVTQTSVTFVPGARDVVAFISDSAVLANQDSTTRRLMANSSYNAIPGQVSVGKFIQLQQGANADYVVNPYAGIVSMNVAVQANQAIAVAYAVPDSTDPRKTIRYGNFGSQTSDSLRLVMKLIKPEYLDPSFPTAWKLMLKNRYPLGGRGIKKDGFDLHLQFDVSGQPPLQTVLNNVNLLQMFGLDRYTDQGSTGSDGKFDYLPGVTIDENRGELIFPTLEPFSTKSIDQLLMTLPGANAQEATAAADSFSFDALYDTTYTGAINSSRNKYEIAGNFTPSVASTYSLGYNIVENSVEVYANNQKATPNVDYTVDYISGQVVIKNQALLAPGTNLQIKYEANDLFQLASKTLVGARGDLDVGKNSTLGFTIMNLNQQSLSDKVRLGEEPISNTIMGVDGGTQLDLGFLTRALNWLPGVNTNVVSQLTFHGEAAYMMPNPNTRTSPIQGDNGTGMAYIDDFEGAKVQIPIGVTWASWTDASPPYFSPTLDDTVRLQSYRDNEGLLWLNPTDKLVGTGLILADSSKIHSKAKASWYNFPFEFTAQQIWDPNRKSIPRDQTQETVLDFHYKPSERGAYNYSMNLDSTLLANPERNWAGIQQVLGTTSTNLLDQNISFIEMWVRIDKSQPTTKLDIDLGFISEAVIPDNILHTEDGLKTGLRTGILHDGEDVGLDGLNDDQERSRYGDFIAKYPQYHDDPSGDDYSAPPLSSSVLPNGGVADPDVYRTADGTENNHVSLTGNYPNTEDLNRNNSLDRINNYFEYEIPLDTANATFQQYVSGQGLNGWFQIRIPINEYIRRIGDPTFTTIEGIRLWVTGAQSEVLFHIAEPNLVGNQWQSLSKNDSTFKVSTVSYEDNPTYIPPDANLRTKDPTRPTENVLSNEQSLDLVVNELQDGDSKQAIKQFPLKPLDVFNYKTMKMFIHGDERMGYIPRYVDTTNYDVEVFFRFGTDSLNYYEYREPVHEGWDLRNQIAVHFDDLTKIKFGRDSISALSARFDVPGGPPGSTYQVLGQPTLTNIRYIAIGVENPRGKGATSYSGEVWADELRLTDVDNASGGAYRFDTGLKLADLGNISFSYMNRDPNFHGLEEQFGSRTTNLNWTLSANFAFDRLLPSSWAGSALQFSYSHVEGFATPKYLPGTDVLVSKAAGQITDQLILDGMNANEAKRVGDSLQLSSQTFTLSESYALPTIRIVLPVDYWLVSETINKMTFGYSYNVSYQRNPNIEFADSWAWNARFGYALNFSPNNFLEIFGSKGQGLWNGLKFYFTPRNFNFSASMNRSQSNEKDRNQAEARPTTRAFAASRSMSFSWQFWDGGMLNPGVDYQVDIQSNLSKLELDRSGNQRSFTDMLGDIFLSDRLVDFGTDQSYGQSISLRTRIVMPKILDLDKIFTPSASYSSRYNWSYSNIQSQVQRDQDLGKGAGVGTSLQLGLDVSIKSIADKIWSSNATPFIPGARDTGKTSINIGKNLDAISRILFKNTLFDFERLSIQFSQSNTIQNNGILGRPGFANIFARVPFVQASTTENGPSFLYQLGLASDPSGQVFIGGKGSFPFITGHTEPGLRAALGNLTDVFAQNNTLTMTTSRPLWEGASLNLNWKLSWAYNSNSSISTDAFGLPSITSQTISGNVDRSFMTFPPVSIFKFFKTGVDQMASVYQTLQADPNDTRASSEKIAQAFEDGFEAIPLSKKILGNIMPRVNWSFHWDGLEKFVLFRSFAQRVSFDHSYQSDYRRQWMVTPDGNQVTQSQEITSGFAPLVGLNMTFKDFMKGSFGGSFRYNINYTYDLAPSSQSLTQNTASTYNFTLNYSRQGFQIPFFGLSLSNDIDMSFTYGLTSNSSKIYDFSQPVFNSSGNPLQGLDNTTMEPRIRYTLSARVTASVYYRLTKVTPGDGGSRIPGSTVNEGGLEVHVSIQ